MQTFPRRSTSALHQRPWAGVPIVYLKANKKKNIAVGDPVIWYYYHGGIKYTPNNPESAASILDADPLTYWEPSSAVDRTTYEALPEDPTRSDLLFCPRRGRRAASGSGDLRGSQQHQ